MHGTTVGGEIDVGSMMSFVCLILYLSFFSVLMLSVVKCDSESTGDYLTTDKGCNIQKDLAVWVNNYVNFTFHN